MTIDQAKAILVEFDRLGLELMDGVNLLTERGIISDHVVLFGDIAKEDGQACIDFLKKMPQ